MNYLRDNQMVSYFSATRTGFPMIAISLKDTVDIEWREAVEVLRLSYNLTLQNSSSEQNFAVLGINVPYTIFD